MICTGIGFDLHPLVKGRKLFLGGVHFDDAKRGLEGHSDADVVCHAIVDALLGAMALGDIGDHFPDSDPAYQDFPGVKFLEAVRDTVAEKNYTIVNIDCTVMSDEVRLGDRKTLMAGTIAAHLAVKPDQVSVKATTWEGFGSIGRKETMACQAIATLARKE